MPRTLPWQQQASTDRSLGNKKPALVVNDQAHGVIKTALDKGEYVTADMGASASELDSQLEMIAGMKHDDRYVMTEIELDSMADHFSKEHYRQLYHYLNASQPSQEPASHASSLARLLASPSKNRKYTRFNVQPGVMQFEGSDTRHGMDSEHDLTPGQQNLTSGKCDSQHMQLSIRGSPTQKPKVLIRHQRASSFHVALDTIVSIPKCPSAIPRKKASTAELTSDEDSLDSGVIDPMFDFVRPLITTSIRARRAKKPITGAC